MLLLAVIVVLEDCLGWWPLLWCRYCWCKLVIMTFWLLVCEWLLARWVERVLWLFDCEGAWLLLPRLVLWWTLWCCWLMRWWLTMWCGWFGRLMWVLMSESRWYNYLLMSHQVIHLSQSAVQTRYEYCIGQTFNIARSCWNRSDGRWFWNYLLIGGFLINFNNFSIF